MKKLLKSVLPEFAWRGLAALRDAAEQGMRGVLGALGYNLARRSDYYSPLPTDADLRRNRARWAKPGSMAGVGYDVERFKGDLQKMLAARRDELAALPPYAQSTSAGFGPGYTELDALVLYMMVRDLKPARYLEVGSGLSTYYCSLAAQRNAKDGHPLALSCIEPHPYDRLGSIAGIEVVASEVQDLGMERFEQLQANDILFIDSSHVVRIDGDVPFLILEVLPRLRKGVVIHVHDIPFPYNVPYPPELWVLGEKANSPAWPVYWNEAMLLQAFLAFNPAFEILMSAPLIRHHDEGFLAANVPGYQPVRDEPNSFSSIWLRKTA